MGSNRITVLVIIGVLSLMSFGYFEQGFAGTPPPSPTVITPGADQDVSGTVMFHGKGTPGATVKISFTDPAGDFLQFEAMVDSEGFWQTTVPIEDNGDVTFVITQSNAKGESGSILRSNKVDTSLDPCAGSFKVYVLLGDLSGAFGANEAFGTSTADKAVENWMDAGYHVIRDDKASSTDVIDALNDPCTRAIWIVGHGAPHAPAISMVDSKITPDPTTKVQFDADLVPKNENLNQVLLVSCDQLVSKWKNHFPGANFDSYWHWANGFFYSVWESFTDYPPIDQTTGEEKPETSAPTKPISHHNLQHDRLVEVAGIGPTCNPSDFQPMFVGTLPAEFGTQSFNFYQTTDDMSESTLLMSGLVEDGVFVPGSLSTDPLVPADFDVTMTGTALLDTFVNPSDFDDFVLEGLVVVDVNNPDLSDETALEGISELYFNIDPPPGVVDLEIEFEAVITEVDDPDGGLAGAIEAGDVIFGDISYSTGAINQNPDDPNFGEYLVNRTICVGVEHVSPPSELYCWDRPTQSIFIANVDGFDEFVATSHDLFQTKGPPLLDIQFFDMFLVDFDGIMFSDGSLPDDDSFLLDLDELTLFLLFEEQSIPPFVAGQITSIKCINCQPDLPDGGLPVGGDIIPLDSTMVLAAGAQYTAAWMIPVIVSAIGIGIVIARKF